MIGDVEFERTHHLVHPKKRPKSYLLKPVNFEVVDRAKFDGCKRGCFQFVYDFGFRLRAHTAVNGVAGKLEQNVRPGICVARRHLTARRHCQLHREYIGKLEVGTNLTSASNSKPLPVKGCIIHQPSWQIVCEEFQCNGSKT